MQDNYEAFSILGLEPRDMYVYEALFRRDAASLRTIAQTTGINRGTVYEIIKKMVDLGLVTFQQVGERRRYSAAPPEVLAAIIEDRRDRLQQLSISSFRYISILNKSREHDNQQYFAQFYEGDEGIGAILRDVLQTLHEQKLEVYCVFSSKDVSKFLYNNFKSFTRQRIKQGVFVRVLADSPGDAEQVLAERRTIPASSSSLSGYVIMYGGKTALISLGEANELAGVVIDERGITNMQELLFYEAWNRGH